MHKLANCEIGYENDGGRTPTNETKQIISSQQTFLVRGSLPLNTFTKQKKYKKNFLQREAWKYPTLQSENQSVLVVWCKGNRRPFIKQPIGSQVTKKREKGTRNSKVAYYNPTTKAKNLMTLFFILSPIFISPSEDKNSWIIAALF